MNLLTEFMSIMNRGGPIMWVIFMAASIAIILLILHGRRLIYYTKLSTHDQSSLMNQNGAFPDINSGSPLSQLLRLLNWPEIKTKQDFAEELNVHIADLAIKIEGSLPTIATIGSLLPMLGLLGTVTGMINVFEVIAVHGSGKPDEMAHGISQAMLTTASGLIIAIPVIFMHHLLTQRKTLIMKNLVQSMQIIIHFNITNIKTNMNTNTTSSKSNMHERITTSVNINN